jgi:hypothetical protein
MIAPRVLFVAEAASDIWANPVGSWQTTLAAAEVYKMLGCEENLFWYFRTGYHAQTLEDVDMLINIIKHKTEGAEISLTPLVDIPGTSIRISVSGRLCSIEQLFKLLE